MAGEVGLARGREEGAELGGWDGFELGVGAVGGGLVGAPAAEVGEVAEAVALHVFVGDFDDEFGAEEFPAEVFATGPSALGAGHAGAGFVLCAPGSPGMMGGGVFAVGSEEVYEFLAFGFGEAGAGADVLELAVVVEEA